MKFTSFEQYKQYYAVKKRRPRRNKYYEMGASVVKEAIKSAHKKPPATTSYQGQD